MFGISWGLMARPKCSCTCECTCKSRMHPDKLQESLDSLGVEWGLYVLPKPRTPPPTPTAPPPHRRSAAAGEPVHRASAADDEAQEDLGAAFRRLHIDDALAQRLCFTERLEVACSESETGGGPGPALGNVTVAVAPSRTAHHLHVRVAGRALMPDGATCSTSVNGCVDYRSLRTADERRFERCDDPSQEVQEKRLYMAQDEKNPSGHYFNIVARQRVGDFEDRRAQDVPFSTVANLASEALIVLLLRYVGIEGFEGSLSLQAVLPNGALVPLYFEASAPKKRVVYGSEVLCHLVTQTSANTQGAKVVLRSLVAHGTGQLLRHAPMESDVRCGDSNRGSFVLRMPKSSVPADDVKELRRPEPLARTWHDDLQAQGTLRDKKGKAFDEMVDAAIDKVEDKETLKEKIYEAIGAGLDATGLENVQEALDLATGGPAFKALDEALDEAIDAVLQAPATDAVDAAIDEAVRPAPGAEAVISAVDDALQGPGDYALNTALDTAVPQEQLDPYGQDPYGGDPYAQPPYGQVPYGQDPYAQGQAPYPQDPNAPWQAPYPQDPNAPWQAPYPQDPNAQGQMPYPQDPNAQGQVPYPQDPNAQGQMPYPQDPNAQGQMPYPQDPNAQGQVPYPQDPNAQGQAPYEEGEWPQVDEVEEGEWPAADPNQAYQGDGTGQAYPPPGDVQIEEMPGDQGVYGENQEGYVEEED